MMSARRLVIAFNAISSATSSTSVRLMAIGALSTDRFQQMRSSSGNASCTLSKSTFLQCRPRQFASSSSSSSSSKPVQSIVPEICKSDLEQLLLADDASHELPFVLIDVREPSELVHGVIPGSHNIPLGELHAAFNLDDKSFLAKFKFSKPTMDARIVAYCRSGARSELATLMLIQGGWIHTRNYRGSFKEWFGRTYGM